VTLDGFTVMSDCVHKWSYALINYWQTSCFEAVLRRSAELDMVDSCEASMLKNLACILAC